MIKRTIVLGALIIFILNGCNTLSKHIRPAQETEVYLGSAQIASSRAYTNFLNSSRTDRDKLCYLLDRIKDSRQLMYTYEGDHYGWVEAYAAGAWILWRHYETSEDARAFLTRETDPDPSQSAYLQHRGGKRVMVYDVLMNELALLDQVLQRAPAVSARESFTPGLGIPFSRELFQFSILLLEQPVTSYAHIFSILPNHTGISSTLTALDGFVNGLFQSFTRY